MATVNVTAWNEFLQAIQVAGDTVVCPVGGVWDFTDAEPITQAIEIKCAKIQGRGTTIKKPNFQVSGDYAIRNQNNLEITDLHWDSITYESSESLPDAFWEFSGKSLTMSGCMISGELIGGISGVDICFNGNCWFTSCAMTITCANGNTKLMYGSGSSSGMSEFCRYLYTTQQTGSIQPFHYLRKCEIVITAQNADGGVKFGNNVSACVIRGTTAVQGVYYGISLADDTYETLSVVSDTLHSHAAESESQLRTEGIVCTDSQLRNAQYLASQTYDDYSFPLGSGDEEWHTGDQEINGGYPYIPKMIGLPVIELHPVKQNPYIIVYSKDSTQQQLQSGKNGLAILTPSICEVTEELNGAFTFSMQHPIDPEGKWQFLQLRNIVKINGELFTILTVEVNYQNNSGYVTCTGEHIFYQLADSWILGGDPISASSGNSFIANVQARTFTYNTSQSEIIYTFTGNADEFTAPAVIVKDVGDGCTPIDALIGSGGMSDQNSAGYAELYRHNFYYSIWDRMEGSLDNAFDIRIGRDLKGIRRTFDTSQFVSWFAGYDKWGSGLAVSWVVDSFIPNYRFPHHIIRSQVFRDLDVGDYGWECLKVRVFSFFRRNCKPILSYEIDLEDVRSNPDFQIMSSERLKVGDQGTLYDSRLGGNITLRISGTVYDAIRDKVVKVTIGDQAHFSAPASPSYAVEPEVIGGEAWIRDADGKMILDADGKAIFQEVVING